MKPRLAKRQQGLVLQFRQKRFYVDPLLLVAVLSLLLLGYVMSSSASLHLGDRLADDFYYPRQQLVHIALGLMAGCAVASINLEIWKKTSHGLFLGGLILLVLVLIPGLGTKVNGSMRWLDIGIRIQVSEVFKLITVIYTASYIDRHVETVRTSVQGLIRPLCLLAIACVLLEREPDLGAAAVIMATALGMLFLGGARLWPFGSLLALLGVLGLTLIYAKGYRSERLDIFWHPFDDAQNTGYQLTQALIAFGRGEWTGVGLGSSVQKLYYLPEAHTDFLFSIIGEELGLWGTTTVILLFSIIVWRALMVGRMAEAAGQRFAAFVAYGLGIWFGLQAFINMGVNMGLLPTKGLTLPLMSYGGGSMIVMCAAVGLLFRIRSEAVEIYAGAPRGKPTWISAS
jgi:cell division protein FtsW